jgi:hypothetical protein
MREVINPEKLNFCGIFEDIFSSQIIKPFVIYLSTVENDIFQIFLAIKFIKP